MGLEAHFFVEICTSVTLLLVYCRLYSDYIVKDIFLGDGSGRNTAKTSVKRIYSMITNETERHCQEFRPKHNVTQHM